MHFWIFARKNENSHENASLQQVGLQRFQGYRFCLSSAFVGGWQEDAKNRPTEWAGSRWRCSLGKKRETPCGRLFLGGDPAATRTQDLLLRRQLLYPAELQSHHLILNVEIRISKFRIQNLSLSGHPDSNWGSPAPKAGAITGLRYIPLVLEWEKTPCRASFLAEKGAPKRHLS